VLTPNAIPLDKKGPLNNITDWNNFKIKLIEELRSINIFGDVNQIFNLLPQYESVQEVAEDLSPKIKTLKANLEIIQQFPNVEDLQSITLTQHLVKNIIKCIPMKVKSDLIKQYMKFRNRCAANV